MLPSNWIHNQILLTAQNSLLNIKCFCALDMTLFQLNMFFVFSQLQYKGMWKRVVLMGPRIVLIMMLLWQNWLLVQCWIYVPSVPIMINANRHISIYSANHRFWLKSLTPKNIISSTIGQCPLSELHRSYLNLGVWLYLIVWTFPFRERFIKKKKKKLQMLVLP